MLRTPPLGTLLLGLLLALLGGTALVRWDIAERREAFATDARIAHRLLSQRAVEVEAVLATVALLDVPEAVRLPALHEAILRVDRQPQTAGVVPATRPLLDARALPSGRVRIELDGPRARHSMELDLSRLVPAGSWPLAADGPVRAELRFDGKAYVLRPGAAAGAAPAGLTPGFVARKTLDASALKLDLHLQRATGPVEWPWGRLALLVATITALLWAAQALRAQRERRRRAEEMLRLNRLGQLNAMGELAAGLAHELNQPLTAALTQSQVALRWLEELPRAGPDDATTAAATAVEQAAVQTRRAADIVKRLRHSLDREGTAVESVALLPLLHDALHLFEPELRAASIDVSGPEGDVPPARADRVALQQIVHNLIDNAVQALQGFEGKPRRLELSLRAEGSQLQLRVADTGAGIDPELLPRLFHPFVSGREGGLGLGLSLSERLASAQEGQLQARNRTAAEGGGAEFTLTLPRASSASARTRPA